MTVEETLQEIARERVRAPRSTVEGVDVALARLRARSGAPPAPRWQVDAERGRTRVGERVVLACARHAAEGVPGVRAAIVRVSVTPGGDGAVLEVVLAAVYGADLRALGDRVRQAVAAEVTAGTGLAPTAVFALVDTVIQS